MSAYAIEMGKRSKDRKLVRVHRSRVVYGMVRRLCTHPWLFGGRVNRKLSVNLLRRRRYGRLGHEVFGVTTLR